MALRQANRLAEAEQALRQAPPEPEALVNLSSVQKELGAFAEAEATLRQALRLAPENPVLRYNWSLLMLLLGRSDEAWDGWEQRFRAGAIPGRPFAQPQWQGDALGDRTLLVHAEQGLGDVIQFARYLPGIQGHVVFEAPARLIRLLAQQSGHAADGPGGCDRLPRVRQRHPAAESAGADDHPAGRAALSVRRTGPDRRLAGPHWPVGLPHRHQLAGIFRPVRGQRTVVPVAPVRSRWPSAGVRLISLQKGEGEEQIADSRLSRWKR